MVLLGPRYGTSIALGISLMIRLANIAGELLAVVLVHCAYAACAIWKRGHGFGRVAAGGSVATS